MCTVQPGAPPGKACSAHAAPPRAAHLLLRGCQSGLGLLQLQRQAARLAACRRRLGSSRLGGRGLGRLHGERRRQLCVCIRQARLAHRGLRLQGRQPVALDVQDLLQLLALRGRHLRRA